MIRKGPDVEKVVVMGETEEVNGGELKLTGATVYETVEKERAEEDPVGAGVARVAERSGRGEK